jgi:hypothetical protein
MARFLVLVAIAIPFFSTAGRENTLYVWRVFTSASDLKRPQWHRQPAVMGDLRELKQAIPPRTVMFHFPPRHNSLYFLLETYSASPFGYVYFTPNLEDIAWDQCEHVVCLTDGLDQTDREYWSKLGGHEKISEWLEARGYRRVDDIALETMELYRRQSR